VKQFPNYLVNSMYQSPSWEANSHSAGQETSRLLCNLQIYYHVYRSLEPVTGPYPIIQSCYVGPCQHGMWHSRVADEVDGLQIWKVAANILIKLLGTTEKGWSTSSWLGEGLTPLRRKKQLVTW